MTIRQNQAQKMEPLILKIIYGLSVLASIVIRTPHERRNKSNKIVDDQKTTLEKVLLFLVFIGMMISPLIYVFTGILDFANYTLPLVFQWAGVLFIVLFVWLFYRSHKDLGQNWSVSLEIRDEHTLVSSGVYRKIRHPMYTAIWCWVIGQSLLLHNYIAGLSGILTFGLMYLLRVGPEEQMMEKTFGEQYKVYKTKTGRLLPKF
ncbi:MAG: protein-S-isoprenylcysteine O-methyltransferase [Bacteroidota bacterium]